LDGTDHMRGVTCNQKHTFLLGNVLQNGSPVLSGLLFAQRRKKTDRGTACYRVLKKCDEFWKNTLALLWNDRFYVIHGSSFFAFSCKWDCVLVAAKILVTDYRL
jgi:hypothetical protein